MKPARILLKTSPDSTTFDIEVAGSQLELTRLLLSAMDLDVVLADVVCAAASVYLERKGDEKLNEWRESLREFKKYYTKENPAALSDKALPGSVK